MFTLVLCFPAQGRQPRSQESVTSGHVPQAGSTINVQNRRVTTWTINHIGQDVVDGVMSNTVYVYLEETD